jgi:predicted nucleotidyltransferase
MVAREIIEILREFQRAVEEKGIRVAKIILYGSQVSGKFHPDSDIDVAVVSPDFGKDRFEEGVKLFQIACGIDPRIEPVPISLEAYDKDTWIPLIYEIKVKGVELVSLAIDEPVSE